MTNHFQMKTWEEVSYTPDDIFPKLATVASANAFSGVLEGESVIRYTTIYLSDEQGQFTGMQTFTGSVEGRQGSFTVVEQGRWDGESVRGMFTVVPGSGTGKLAGITGSGEYKATHNETEYPYTFDYTLPGR